MTWLEQDRLKWEIIRTKRTVRQAAIVVIVGSALIALWAAADNASRAHRGAIICNDDGTVTIDNNDINLNFRVSADEFWRRARMLCGSDRNI